MRYLYILCFILYSLSLIKNREKTLKSIKTAWKMLINILPMFLMMLIIMSVSLYFIPASSIAEKLSGKNEIIGTLIASLVGSIIVIPGFIAFPLSGVLLKEGVSYMILAAFTTTLMMVGVITFPVEQKYFGVKLTVIRNITSYIIAIIISLVIGVIM